jgi:hypothetical protein
MRNSARCRIPEPKRDQEVDVHDRYGRTRQPVYDLSPKAAPSTGPGRARIRRA